MSRPEYCKVAIFAISDALSATNILASASASTGSKCLVVMKYLFSKQNPEHVKGTSPCSIMGRRSRPSMYILPAASPCSATILPAYATDVVSPRYFYVIKIHHGLLTHSRSKLMPYGINLFFHSSSAQSATSPVFSITYPCAQSSFSKSGWIGPK